MASVGTLSRGNLERRQMRSVLSARRLLKFNPFRGPWETRAALGVMSPAGVTGTARPRLKISDLV